MRLLSSIRLPLLVLAAVGCHKEVEPIYTDADCSASTEETGGVFFLADGDDLSLDVTAEFTLGSAEEPTVWTLDEPGALMFCPGEWFTRLQITAPEATVGGVDGGAGVTLSAGGDGATLLASSTTLLVDGISLTGGGGRFGGALEAESTDLTLQDVTISGNAAEDQGGGVYLYYSEMSLRGGAIDGNTAQEGGGIYAFESELTLDGGSISGNAAENGGGIFLEDAELSGAPAMRENEAIDGGGIFMERSYALLQSGEIAGSVASGDGGGLYMLDSYADMEAAFAVADNSAAGAGGGAYLDFGDLLIYDGSFSGNDAARGGALALYESRLEAGALTLVDNSAAETGGGLQLYNSDASGESVSASGNTPDDIFNENTKSTYTIGDDGFDCGVEGCAESATDR